ncbi:MAG: hypothetical protein HYZ14_12455 [Bacteroidetes bacterium]|nr:hypothetical protein [Bacteroidota bacterium]
MVPKQNLKDLPDDILHYQMNEFLGDYFMDQRVPDTKKVRALFEAFYGLVNNKSLVWFLGSPLIKTDFNFTYYMQLWKGGGDYRIENNSVLVGL